MKKNDLLNPLLFCGYDLSPLPLDFTNEITTTKWLGVILAKLNNVLEFTKNIYNVILEDLTEGGELYKALSSAFTKQIDELEKEIQLIKDRLYSLEYITPVIEVTDEYNYIHGDIIHGAVFNYKLTHSEEIQKIELLKDGKVINNITSNIDDNGFISTNQIIENNTVFTIKVYDGVSIVSKDIKFIFSNPLYCGVISDKTLPSENLIKSTFEVKNSHDKIIEYNFNNVNGYICIISDGIKIRDINKNVLNDFTISDITINLDTDRTLKCYIFNNYIENENINLFCEVI